MPKYLMRILFDKGTPRPLRRRLFGHEVETSVERGWDTLANGVLMDRAEEAGFEVLLTTDQSIRYQQNMSNRQIAVVETDEHEVPPEILAAHSEEHRKTRIHKPTGANSKSDELREVPWDTPERKPNH